MLKIEKRGTLSCRFDLQPEDKFVLLINGDRVHEELITGLRYVTDWCLIRIGDSGLAYAIGTEQLIPDLLAAGAVDVSGVS